MSRSASYNKKMDEETIFVASCFLFCFPLRDLFPRLVAVVARFCLRFCCFCQNSSLLPKLTKKNTGGAAEQTARKLVRYNSQNMTSYTTDALQGQLGQPATIPSKARQRSVSRPTKTRLGHSGQRQIGSAWCKSEQAGTEAGWGQLATTRDNSTKTRLGNSGERARQIGAARCKSEQANTEAGWGQLATSHSPPPPPSVLRLERDACSMVK